MSFNSRWLRIAKLSGKGMPLRFHGAARWTGWLAVLFIQGVAMANTDAFQLQGEGTLRWFGLKIYDARLFSTDRLAPERVLQHPFALELTYARDFSGLKIAETSLEEIRKLTGAPADRTEQWFAQMQRIFPSVKSGDRLRGVYEPGRAAHFYFNSQFIGSIQDAEFARAFFSIWLDPRTTKPDLRSQLLGRASSRTP